MSLLANALINYVNSVTYPSAFDVNGNTVAGPTYTYTYDTVSRPIKLTDNQSVEWAKDVLYGPANELKQISFNSGGGSYFTETRSYNSRMQLTRMTVPFAMDMEYRYSSNQNNGQITQQKDWVSGEEVAYAYDSLSRLISAVTTGPEWGQSFSYDGFGNRTGASVTKGSAPASSFNFDAATNRIIGGGFSYDANGNMTAGANVAGINYDVENRVVSTSSGGGFEQYAYAADGKRIWKKLPGATEEFNFYGIAGQKLGTYRAATGANGYGMFVLNTNLYFGNKLLRSRGTTVVTDRLGSVRSSGGLSSRYFPFGEEQQVTAQDREKFDGNYRDGTTGLDYADSRYYANTLGAFLTPDSGRAVGSTASPGNLNRYSFMRGDPAGNSSGMVAIDETGRFDDSGNTVRSYVAANATTPVSSMPALVSSALPPATQPASSVIAPSAINPTTIWTPQSGYIAPGYGSTLYASLSVPYQSRIPNSSPAVSSLVNNDNTVPADAPDQDEQGPKQQSTSTPITTPASQPTSTFCWYANFIGIYIGVVGLPIKVVPYVGPVLTFAGLALNIGQVLYCQPAE